MKFEIGCAIINFCKEHTLLEFEETFSNPKDLFEALDLPATSYRILYRHLNRALVRDLKEWETLSVKSSSKGNQKKYYSSYEDAYIKLRFFYQNKYWCDELVELLASDLFKNLGVVEQIPVWTPEGWGCYSKNFAKSKSFVTYNTILETSSFVKLPKDNSENFEFIKKVIREETSLDATDYLLTIALTDAVVLNEDRHWNNFGVMYDGNFYIAPIFDYGLGLFECDEMYQYRSDIITARRDVKAKPFLTNHFKTITSLVNAGYINELQHLFYKIDWDLPNLYAPNVLAISHICKVKSELEELLCLK